MNQICTATEISRHIDYIQSLIDRGESPETNNKLAGLVKLVEEKAQVEAPGKRFRPVTVTRTRWTVDAAAVRRRVENTRIKRALAQQQQAATANRFQFIELESRFIYNTTPQRCDCPARKFNPSMPCKHMIAAAEEWAVAANG